MRTEIVGDLQAIEALSQDKMSLKEQLDRTNEKIKQMEEEKRGQRFSISSCDVIIYASLVECSSFFLLIDYNKHAAN